MRCHSQGGASPVPLPRQVVTLKSLAVLLVLVGVACGDAGSSGDAVPVTEATSAALNPDDLVSFVEYDLPALEGGEYIIGNIPLTLTVTEVNQILASLGKRPFSEVEQLTGKIEQQGDPFFDGAEPETEEVPLTLTLAEINQILASLGQESFGEVQQLFEKITEQGRAFLDG